MRDIQTMFLANQTFEVCTNIQIKLPADWVGENWKVRFHSRDKDSKITVNDNVMTVETELAGNDWIMLYRRKY